MLSGSLMILFGLLMFFKQYTEVSALSELDEMIWVLLLTGTLLVAIGLSFRRIEFRERKYRICKTEGGREICREL